MEKLAEFRNLSFKYPKSDKYALKNINLDIMSGDFIVVCGKSGCGKTTLLRQLKKPLVPAGERSGLASFRGCEITELDLRADSEKIGFVMQNPDNQIVTDKVWHEMAFGLESLGLESAVIRRRIAEMAHFFGIEEWFHKNVSELSGGQKQLLNLASVMVMRPELLVLDEPTAYLDPIAAEEFLNAVRRVNDELGTAVIISEHRLQELLPVCTRAVVMEGGEIIVSGSARECGGYLKNTGSRMFGAMSAPMRIWAQTESNAECPLTVKEGREWLKEFLKTHKTHEIKPRENIRGGDYIIEADKLWFRYERNSPDVVRGLDMRVRSGSIYAIMGGNGAGKTTALSLLTGIRKPIRGKLKINRQSIDELKRQNPSFIGMVPQNPKSLFTRGTVKDEIARQGGELNKVLAAFELTGLENRHPYDLSGGEQQRLALAKVMMRNPRLLLLDEPTKGIDAEFKDTLGNILEKLADDGVTIVLVSHDVEFCASYADYCAIFFDGHIAAEGETREFLSSNSFYSTAAGRMAAGIIENAVTAEDIIYACSGQEKERNTEKIIYKTEPEKKAKNRKLPRFLSGKMRVLRSDTDRRKNVFIPSVISLALIAVTIYIGMYYLGDTKAAIISMLIIPEALIPFFASFEKRRPKARELVIIAVLCALAVLSRAAFYMFQQLKPMAAVIIIAGISFGGEAGFIVGAVSAFASNMFFGQGPWTPWQMLAFGMIGLMSGVLFNIGIIRSNKYSAAFSGFLLTLIFYGGIMNLYSAIAMKINLFVAYAQGLPFDLIHSAGVAVFLLVSVRPFTEKINRIKIKYGLAEDL